MISHHVLNPKACDAATVTVGKGLKRKRVHWTLSFLKRKHHQIISFIVDSMYVNLQPSLYSSLKNCWNNREITYIEVKYDFSCYCISHFIVSDGALLADFTGAKETTLRSGFPWERRQERLKNVTAWNLIA